MTAAAPEIDPGVSGWTCAEAAVDRLGAVRLTLARTGSVARVVMRLSPGAEGGRHGQGMVRTAVGFLRVEGTTFVDPRAAAELLAAFARAQARWVPAVLRAFPHTAFAATGALPEEKLRAWVASTARALGCVAGPPADPGDTGFELTAAGVRAVMRGADVLRGGPGEVFELRGVFDAGEPGGRPVPPHGVWLEFAVRGVATRDHTLGVVLGFRWSFEDAFVTVAGLALCPPPGVEVTLEHARLLGLLAVALAARTDAGYVPRPAEGWRRGEGTVVVTLRAECEQSCEFCSLKQSLPPVDGGTREARDVLDSLRAARASGARVVQLDGIDPLAHSEILAIAAGVRALGFERLVAAGTGRRLADASFRRAFFAAAPDDTLVLVPVYGTSAGVHDAVTGAPGSFAEAREAVRAVCAERGAGALVVGLCVTKTNLSEFAGVLAWAVGLGAAVWLRLPYPHDDARPEGFVRAAVRETDVVTELVRAGEGMDPGVRERVAVLLAGAVSHPCVFERVARAQGAAWLLRARGDVAARLHGAAATGAAGGTNMSSAEAARTLVCRHAGECALAARCSRAHFAAYVGLFGDGEFEVG